MHSVYGCIFPFDSIEAPRSRRGGHRATRWSRRDDEVIAALTCIASRWSSPPKHSSISTSLTKSWLPKDRSSPGSSATSMTAVKQWLQVPNRHAIFCRAPGGTSHSLDSRSQKAKSSMRRHSTMTSIPRPLRKLCIPPASALSVLTDREYFQGSLDYLKAFAASSTCLCFAKTSSSMNIKSTRLALLDRCSAVDRRVSLRLTN